VSFPAIIRVVVTGAAWASGADQEGAVDGGRLRRMDRFGRSGFVAGSLALARSGFVRPSRSDPRAGVVFGSAFGCRDSVASHAALLSAVARVEDLSPAIFAQTVHNSVAGELAIEWRLGGVSETLVSGPCAGLEAVLLAARRIEEGAADLVVAGGAEGVDPALREAWERGGNTVLEMGAALVLERETTAAVGRPLARLLGGTSFFEPVPAEAAARLVSWAASIFGGGGPEHCVLGAPDNEQLAERLPWRSVRAAEDETLGAGGPLAAARALLDASAPRALLVVAREPGGSIAATAFSSGPTPRTA
jgi:hypothetical protein